MQNLFLSILHQARADKKGVMAVNILNYNTTRAILRAAVRCGRPVILQPSTGTVKRYGVQETIGMVDVLRRQYDIPAALHLDHCRDTQLALACIEAGWDAVMMDLSALEMSENVRRTREVVERAHAKGVAVEGEVGVIRGVEDEVSSDSEELAGFEETMEFIQQSGVDAIAPAIGTAHGVYTGIPKLNFGLVQQLADSQPCPVVIHGGTGLPEADFKHLIECGASKINISTALKQVYLGSSRTVLEEKKVAPVDFDERVEDAVSERMEQFMRLFAGEEVVL